MAITTATLPLGDRIARRVLQALSALPMSWQRRLGGAPRVIDGQMLHPSTQLGLRLLELLGEESFEKMPVAQARQEVSRQLALIGDSIAIGEIRNFSIEGPRGPIPLRLYRPEQGGRELPLIVYFHGGGWVVGDLEECDSVCRFMAKHGQLAVLSVDYRLAPEHRFPAGLEDCLAAFDHAVQQASALGCDPGLVGVAGESAGGNITLALSQICAERAGSTPGAPTPAFQIPLQPVTDLSCKRPSYGLFGAGFALTEAQMDWYKAHYLGDESQALDPRASPLLASDLRGQPPTLMVVAGFDPLRDEALDYARRLQDAGVPTAVRLFEGSTHAQLNATGVGRYAREMLLEIVGATQMLIGLARARRPPA